MCAHSSSAAEVTQHIVGVLYPGIRQQFALVKRCGYNHQSKQATDFYDLAELLKQEFGRLSEYEEKEAFPLILQVFNTKDDPSFTSTVNINDVQKLVQQKERLIQEMVYELEIEADELCLSSEHAIYPLIKLFKQDYEEQKKQWYSMLEGWSRGCACFINAAKFKLPGIEQLTAVNK